MVQIHLHVAFYQLCQFTFEHFLHFVSYSINDFDYKIYIDLGLMHFEFRELMTNIYFTEFILQFIVCIVDADVNVFIMLMMFIIDTLIVY